MIRRKVYSPDVGQVTVSLLGETILLAGEQFVPGAGPDSDDGYRSVTPHRDRLRSCLQSPGKVQPGAVTADAHCCPLVSTGVHLKCHAIAGGNAAISWKAVALNEDTEKDRQQTTNGKETADDDPSSSAQ